MALLGAMSIIGMMLKSGIVLLAAGTTLLGVISLYSDSFWASMSDTIMAGLIVGALVTLLLLPALYALICRLKVPS